MALTRGKPVTKFAPCPINLHRGWMRVKSVRSTHFPLNHPELVLWIPFSCVPLNWVRLCRTFPRLSSFGVRQGYEREAKR
ncbi:hypothetical protein H3T23_07805 [Bacteroides fragilis]|uniref:Uncharacterized protein n=3 Tax=Bacteroidales TaxID=171549 RepID=A0A6A1KBK0_9BACE|nr:MULTISPECIES: hypothetical protein [Bacteroidales]MDC1569479.1 hypothetical protein [Phocaeicola vulgatus]KAA4698885.1 hypothetical protein F3B26_18825 [Bacteroides fragilis]KAA4699974.1 hypothetical protein F3B28_10710 [Bacteroides fragilis]KAA4708494.1 hypothetical protein F3B27_09535 [Bacteroides fragilis]KAA4717827.1 hypothetical protein F3B32_12475 [Bacteroides fragilis]